MSVADENPPSTDDGLLSEFIARLRTRASAAPVGVSRRSLARLLEPHKAKPGEAPQAGYLLMRGVVQALWTLTSLEELKPRDLSSEEAVFQLASLYQLKLAAAARAHNTATKWPTVETLRGLVRKLESEFADATDKRPGDEGLVRRARRLAEVRGAVPVAMLGWIPSPARSPTTHSDLGARLIADLVSAAYPKAEEIDFIQGSSTKATLDKLIRGDAALGFGMYETAVRFRRGLDFARIPGLVGHLAVVQVVRRNGTGTEQPRLTWREILSGHRDGGRESIYAVVFQDEVGHALLAAARYRSHKEGADLPKDRGLMRILPPRTDARDGAAKMYAKAIECLEDNDRRVLVAGMPDCVDLISEHERTIRLKKRKAFWDDHRLELIPYDDLFTPWYPLGIAIRASEPRFLEVIRKTLELELFGAALPRTCQWYVDVLDAFYRTELLTQEALAMEAIANVRERLSHVQVPETHDAEPLQQLIEELRSVFCRGLDSESTSALMDLLRPRRDADIARIDFWLTSNDSFLQEIRIILYEALAQFPRWLRIEEIGNEKLRRRMGSIVRRLVLKRSSGDRERDRVHLQSATQQREWEFWRTIRMLRDFAVPPM